jgi:hypothetical protein
MFLCRKDLVITGVFCSPFGKVFLERKTMEPAKKQVTKTYETNQRNIQTPFYSLFHILSYFCHVVNKFLLSYIN